MEFKLKRKPTLSDTTWELQRRAYVQKAANLNPEFAQFKLLEETPVASNAEIEFALPAHAEPREVIHLPNGYHHLQVYSGKAWVTYKAKDHVLKAGDELFFDHDSQEAVISSTGKQTLNFRVN